MSDLEILPELANPEGKPHSAPPVTNALLRDVFDYGISDLNQNVMGRASTAQRERYASTLKNENDALWLMMMIFLSMTLVIAIITLGSTRFQSFYLAVGSGVMLGLLWLFSTRRTNKLRAALDNPRARRVVGEAKLAVSGGWARTPLLIVKDQAFKLTPEQANALKDYALGKLRVYYLENVQHILAVETVDGASDNESDDDEKRKNEEILLLDDDAPAMQQNTR